MNDESMVLGYNKAGMEESGKTMAKFFMIIIIIFCVIVLLAGLLTNCMIGIFIGFCLTVGSIWIYTLIGKKKVN